MSAEFTMAFFKVRKVFHFHGVNASSRHMPMGSNPATRTIRKADESERRPWWDTSCQRIFQGSRLLDSEKKKTGKFNSSPWQKIVVFQSESFFQRSISQELSCQFSGRRSFFHFGWRFCFSVLFLEITHQIWNFQSSFLDSGYRVCLNEQWKNPGCLGYIGGYTTQLYRDYNTPL